MQDVYLLRRFIAKPAFVSVCTKERVHKMLFDFNGKSSGRKKNPKKRNESDLPNNEETLWVVTRLGYKTPFMAFQFGVNATNSEIEDRILKIAHRKGMTDLKKGDTDYFRAYGAKTPASAVNMATLRSVGFDYISPEAVKNKKSRRISGMSSVDSENNLYVVYKPSATGKYRVLRFDSNASDRDIHMGIAETEHTRPFTIAFCRAPNASDPKEAVVYAKIQKGLRYYDGMSVLREISKLHEYDMEVIMKNLQQQEPEPHPKRLNYESPQYRQAIRQTEREIHNAFEINEGVNQGSNSKFQHFGM